jgi:hypothetical protein
MNRIKILSLPIASAVLVAAPLPADAEVALSLSSQKTFRQNKKGATAFRGGRFDIVLREGNAMLTGHRTCLWIHARVARRRLSSSGR